LPVAGWRLAVAGCQLPVASWRLAVASVPGPAGARDNRR
jgi:hypothetical protein